MDNINNSVEKVYGVLTDKYKAENSDMNAVQAIYKEMYGKLKAAKENNVSMDEALELHKEVFLKSVGVNSESELNQGQKIGFTGHMHSVKGKSVEELLETDMKILEKFIG